MNDAVRAICGRRCAGVSARPRAYHHSAAVAPRNSGQEKSQGAHMGMLAGNSVVTHATAQAAAIRTGSAT